MTMKKVIQNNNKYELVDVEPIFGGNYNIGYIGFSYDTESIISKWIVKFTKNFNYSGIKVSHALIVVGENLCVEASASERKVILSPLTKYFNNSNTPISFRKPRDLTIEAAEEIAELAKSKIDCPYEMLQIPGHIWKALPFINQFNRFTRNIFIDPISNLVDNKNKFICSELAAYSLKNAKSWKHNHDGILARWTTRLNPQELFEDRKIFSDWTL